MASKYQKITALYESTIKSVTDTPAAWTAFLRSACRNYKCRFGEQLLIYAQHPDATAVLEIEKWNKQFGRWVNKGVTGIAVFDEEHNGPYRLKHYFDISDTHESRFSRPVPVWSMKPEYIAEVIETLENSFGDLDDKSTLADALISAAKNTVDDNLTDYLRDLMPSREDSLLEELDDFNVAAEYRATLHSSVAYMLLTRCGINADKYLDREDFKYISDFNTRATVNAIGFATNAIAETCLREISATVLNLQKSEKNQNRTFAKPDNSVHNVPKTLIIERGFDDGTDIPHGGRLSRPESDRAGGTARNPWQIRVTPQKVSERAARDSAPESADIGRTQQAFDGDRADGDGAHGVDGLADGGGAGRDGADESRESDAVGGNDEQHPALSGGNDTARTDIRIKPLPTVNEQLYIYGEAEESAVVESSAFASLGTSGISQQIIDEILTSGVNEQDSTLRIVAYFKKDHPTDANADFLRQEYRTGGKGFIFGGNHFSVWFNEQGILIATGNTAINADYSTLITWEQAARRIRELLDMGRYMPQSELDKVDGNEVQELARKLYFLYRDDFGRLPEEWTVNGTLHAESIPVIAELLCTPETLERIIGKLDADLQIARTESRDGDFNNARQFRSKAPDILRGVRDLQREPLVFTADESVSAPHPGFITQDEIDRVLIGSGAPMNTRKLDIYAYFLQNHTAKEKADFLNHAYGVGGFSRTGFDEWHDGKGIAYSRENNHMPYDKVILSWPKVARRIGELIADGRYMSQPELDYIPEYEVLTLAREIVSFYPRQPIMGTPRGLPRGERRSDGVSELSPQVEASDTQSATTMPRPFPHGADYQESVKLVRTQLDEPDRVAEILSQMAAILDTTPADYRYYESMRKAFNNLTAHQNGEYSLFAPANESTEQAAIPAPLPSVLPDAEYDLQLGATVFLGIEEFELNAIDDTRVVLRDMSAPLFTLDMPRDEFDRKLRENRLNDGLIVSDAAASEAQAAPEPAPYTPKRGDRYEIDGRMFVVDTVDTDWDSVKLRDVTFENNTGIPIFRSESLEFIRMYEPIRVSEPEITYAVGDRFTQMGNEYEIDSVDDFVRARRIDLNDPTDGKIQDYANYTRDGFERQIKSGGVVFKRPQEQTEHALTPAWENPKPRTRTQTFDAFPGVPMSERHNYRITDDNLGAGGAKTKYRNNVEAIRTLQSIEAETVLPRQRNRRF